MSCGAALTLSLPGTSEGARPSEFLSELEKQCSAGNPEVCVLLANQYQGGPRDLRDPYRAIEFKQRACELGALFAIS
jgi:TPR repeat protein